MLRFAALVLATLLLAACAVQYDEKNFVWPRPSGPLDVAKAQAALPAGYRVETGFVAAADGQQLYRVAFVHPQARSDVLFFPGNGFQISTEAVLYARPLLAQWRPNIVFYDYRGSGQSGGTPSVATLRSDALLAFDAERQRAQAQGRKLAVMGFSLGGVAAAGVAEVRRPDALVLMATGTNATEFAEEAVPWYAKPFVDVQIAPSIVAIDTRRGVGAYTGPLLIVAGGADRTTPQVLAERLYAAAATPAADKRLLIVPGAGHMQVLDSTELAAALAQFAAQNGL